MEQAQLSKEVMSDAIQLPVNRAIVLRNATCAYCGRLFGADQKETKEHVIGRRFVPKGALAGQWNLILNACNECNGDKSDLEDDISVISMMPDQFGQYAIDDQRLKDEVLRKSTKSQSRRTGKKVADSQEQITIGRAFGAGTLALNFTAPVQVEEARLYQLAHYHFRGFFYWLTYQRESNVGGFIRGEFFPLSACRKTDWGAPRLRWFMDLAREWDIRLCAIGADTFFKALVRRDPKGTEVWLWAFEWNHSIRVVGFAGNEGAVRALLARAPDQAAAVLSETEKEMICFRPEVSLPADQDDLFAMFVDY